MKRLGRVAEIGHRISGDRASQRGRYQRRLQGSLGREYVHLAIDDYSRLAYAEVLTDEKASTAAGFLERAVAFYPRHGIVVERVLSDNGACYHSVIHALACRRLRIRHLGPAHTARRHTGKQNRTVHPHPAQRPGLRRDLPIKP